MIALTPDAEAHLDELRRHYENLERFDALANLRRALTDASDLIERNPQAGTPAPRSYPRLARPGRAWIKVGRYWFVYSTDAPPLIMGVFYETADLPNRL